jgi:ribonuclease T2
MLSRLALLLACLAGPARSDTAGDFDYYVLSLSWSANWCALEGDARGSPQ